MTNIIDIWKSIYTATRPANISLEEWGAILNMAQAEYDDENLAALVIVASAIGGDSTHLRVVRSMVADRQGRKNRRRNAAAAELGQRGRAVNSEAQQEAARANGAKGGRPRRNTVIEHEPGELGVVVYENMPPKKL